VGQRGDFTLTLDGEPRELESDWGISTLHRFRDADANLAVWFASGSVFYHGLEPGKTYRLRATVKDHTDYQGEPQTKFTRVKVTGEIDPETGEIKEGGA
jgi:hypothetical protein